MNSAFSINVVLLEGVLIVLSIGQDVRVETRVLKRAVPHAFVEVLARDCSQCILVLLDHLVLQVSVVDHPGAGDDQVTVGSADGAGSVVLLLDLLVVGGSPVSDALQTEGVAAALQDSKSSSVAKHLLQTDHALFIAFVLSVALLVDELLWRSLQTLGMHVLAVVTVLAPSLFVKLTDDPVRVVLEEVVDDLIVIAAVVEVQLVGLELFVHSIDLVHAEVDRVLGVVFSKVVELLHLPQGHLFLVHVRLVLLQLHSELRQHRKVLLAKLSLQCWVVLGLGQQLHYLRVAH